jgi:hypothetical protein
MDTIQKVKALVAALMNSNQQPPMRRPLPQIPQNGLANQAQRTIQNRGNQLNRAIDDAS